jgi:hypothetical protein
MFLAIYLRPLIVFDICWKYVFDTRNPLLIDEGKLDLRMRSSSAAPHLLGSATWVVLRQNEEFCVRFSTEKIPFLTRYDI